ncbi:MAG: SDR family NAD(P)-dependent oxidoreductase [Chloroflexi bacterium]|nr:SDR family NAD(P)-dependent oxidoreductase [Chloroflexota bacterium]
MLKSFGDPYEPSPGQQVAIVTGAGRGIGEAIAHALADAPASPSTTSTRTAPNVSPRPSAKTGQAIGIAADVSNKFQCSHLIETTRAEWNQLDILVNNAAVEPAIPIMKMDEWDWQRTIDVNLKGVFL